MIEVLTKVLALCGAVLLAVPALRSGNFRLVVGELGEKAQSPDVKTAINLFKKGESRVRMALIKSDIFLIRVGLILLGFSFLLDLITLLAS